MRKGGEETDEERQDLYTRYQRIRQKEFYEIHNIPYDKRTEEDWEKLQEFFEDIMEEANAEQVKKSG